MGNEALATRNELRVMDMGQAKMEGKETEQGVAPRWMGEEDNPSIDVEHEEAYFVAIEMVRNGGSFVSNLGEALRCADIHNVRKIKSTWPDYWKKYKQMAIAEAKRREAEKK